MKKLAFAALLCGGLAQLATGCIIVSEDEPLPPDPDPPVVEEGSVLATWSLESGDEALPADCPLGYDTIEIVTQDANGDQIVSQFDCFDGAGTITRYPGTYLIWARLTDDTGTVTAAMSLSSDVVITANVEEPKEFAFSIDRGSFYFQWVLSYDGTPTDCDSEDVGNVAVTSTLVGDAGTAYDDEQPCAAGQLTTGAMELGEYTLSVSLLDSTNSGAIYVADPIVRSLEYGNHFHDLGTFDLDAFGNGN